MDVSKSLYYNDVMYTFHPQRSYIIYLYSVFTVTYTHRTLNAFGLTKKKKKIDTHFCQCDSVAKSLVLVAVKERKHEQNEENRLKLC